MLVDVLLGRRPQDDLAPWVQAMRKKAVVDAMGRIDWVLDPADRVSGRAPIRTASTS